MNLSGVIHSFRLPDGLTVERTTGDYDDGGLWVDQHTTPVLLDPVAIMPLTGKEVQVLPEGLRTKNSIQLFSAVEPMAVEEGGNRKGDTFTYNGQTFEIHIVEDWHEQAGYWRAVAVEVDG